MKLRIAALFSAAAMLAACDENPDAPSAEENRELDRAAEMLDEAPNSLDRVDDSGLAANGSDEAGDDSGS